MGEDVRRLDDPRFRRRLKRRSRWRWGCSAFLIGAYLLWAVAGLYFPHGYAMPIPGSSVPAGMAAGILIIVLAIVLSIVYVRVVNRIGAEATGQDRA